MGLKSSEYIDKDGRGMMHTAPCLPEEIVEKTSKLLRAYDLDIDAQDSFILWRLCKCCFINSHAMSRLSNGLFHPAYSCRRMIRTIDTHCLVQAI